MPLVFTVRTDYFVFSFVFSLASSLWKLFTLDVLDARGDHHVPQIHNVVFVVSSVEVDVVGIHQLEGKQDQQDLNGVFPSIHKVSVEDVRRLH